MIKRVLFILIVSLSAGSLFAQKLGYKEIQIGKTLKNIKDLQKYKLTPDTAHNDRWFITGDSLRIFLTDIGHLEITVDKNEVIKWVAAYTKERVFEDYKDWLYELGYLLNVINSDLGKLNSSDVSRPLDSQLSLAWSFTDTKTALSLATKKVDKSIFRLKGNYTLTWAEDPHNMAGLKF